MSNVSQLSEFLAEVVMTSYYLDEPVSGSSTELHDAEMKSLKIIAGLGPMPMQGLANILGSSKSRATQIVCQLEKYSLVERTIGNDKRIHLVSATEIGKREVEQLRSKYIRLAESIERRLGEDRTRELCELLSEITPLVESTNQRRELPNEINL